MAAVQQNLSKMVSAQLRNKANEFLSSRKHANNILDILKMFEAKTDNYTPLLLTIEVIFIEVLKRGDMIQEIVPLKPAEHTPESQYIIWLKECYETALKHALKCMKHGHATSRQQALVTVCKLLQAEGRHPTEKPSPGYYFPSVRLKNLFSALLDNETAMSGPIIRFQEFTEFRDVQQYGLKILCTLAYRKNPTQIYMQNYLELLDKLLMTDILHDAWCTHIRHEDIEEKLLCDAEGKAPFPYNAGVCRRYANRCWGFACQWPLLRNPKLHRRGLLLLVERLLPVLARPTLANDMLADSLDAGGATSLLALQGILELVRRHNIDYPELYDKLYTMFEPEMFAMRHKQRLMHLADIFLSSTYLPEHLVAAFAKRLSRLALVAVPADACGLLQLVANLLTRHPCLKRMICYEDTPAVMSNDPYVMEDVSPARSRALGSSLWEVAALRRHAAATVSAAAAKVLHVHHVPANRAHPVSLAPQGDQGQFDAELKKRFKSIEMNFTRPIGMNLPVEERLRQYYEIMA